MRTRVAIVLAVISAPALAQQQADMIYLRGWGATKCESWTAERNKTPPVVSAAQANWVFGFLGAYNHYMHTGPGSGIDAQLDQDAILARLDRYCEAHPTDIIAMAASALVKELGGRD